MPNNIFYDWVSEGDLDEVLKLETKGFPSDEAASAETFRFRHSQARELFLGAYLSDNHKLVGYVCSTLSPSTSLTHESMSNHVPSSPSVCLHGLCVSSNYRRGNIGSGLLREYISRMESARKDGSESYERILLITHEELRPFYEKASFEWVGKSDIVHGSRPWFEMRRSLTGLPPPTSSPSLPPAQIDLPQALPPGAWEALQRPSRSGPAPRLLSSFSGGAVDIISQGEETGGTALNKFNLICPREGCGSIILTSGVAKWVERPGVQMEPPNLQRSPLLPELPMPPDTTQWWLVTPSVMTFENIGFSRPLQPEPSQATSKKLQLLACAECDLGPLGWSEDGGNEFWLACSRVGYRQ